MDLDYYLRRTSDAEKHLRLETQWKDAVNSKTITCCCGQLRALEMAFRCLYCGEWFCCRCAEEHFGETLQEYTERKRVELRARLETHRNAVKKI